MRKIKKIWSSFKIAFSMYSKIPMPKTDWTEENMRYSLCFFPLIGVIIGALECAFIYLAKMFDIGVILTSAICVFISLFITGGIHADGFCDTSDAISSYKSKEEKLKILKDSHTGAFAVIRYTMYILLLFAGFVEVVKMPFEMVVSICFIFVISRALSALTCVNFKSAKNDGMLFTFTKSTHRAVVNIVLVIILILALQGMLCFSPLIVVACIISGGMVLLYYRFSVYKKFGGITGDLAGYFLSLEELVMIIASVISYKVMLWI